MTLKKEFFNAKTQRRKVFKQRFEVAFLSFTLRLGTSASLR